MRSLRTDSKGILPVRSCVLVARHCSNLPVKAVLIRILLKVVARANLEEEVSQVLSRHLDRHVDPLAGLVLPSDDPRIAPGAT
jgi:hypothetical protein